ncbi:MAG: hypothetical protein DHS20C21_12150 [Gemmatimonadota bacterium]|nr:MAG: hypothetical protein DHS20C21_12150 [Gemmatimonadota bacterium]
MIGDATRENLRRALPVHDLASFWIQVGPSNTGQGVFARRPISAGQRILDFRGEAIDFPGTLAMGDSECNALQIGSNLYLDLEPPGCLVNHSCEPNAGVRDGTHLVVLRDVAAGEEITFDYSTTMDENHWTLQCLCGSATCRGTIRDFRWLPESRKLALIRQGIVPAFIVAVEIDSGRLSAEQIDTACGTDRRGG